MNDSTLRTFTSPLEQLGKLQDQGYADEQALISPKYRAAWEDPAGRQRPEVAVFIWGKTGDCNVVMYPFMQDLKYSAEGVVSFEYNGRRFTLKGPGLRDVFIKLGLHRWRHLQELNPRYHEPVSDGEPCIEKVLIEDS